MVVSHGRTKEHHQDVFPTTIHAANLMEYFGDVSWIVFDMGEGENPKQLNEARPGIRKAMGFTKIDEYQHK
jgi:hypothetical protein